MTGIEPGICEIANALNLDNDEVISALELKLTCESLDDHENMKGSSEVEDKLLDYISIQGELDKLEPRERQLIILRYYRELTQASVAKIMGMTQVQVCRLEKKILTKLKNEIGE